MKKIILFPIVSTLLFGGYSNIGSIGQSSFRGKSQYLNPEAQNHSPKIEVSENISLDEDNNFSLSFISSDYENDDVEVEVLKNGNLGVAKIDRGEILYTPFPNRYGNDTITLKFSDGFGGFEIKEINISVISVNDAPQIEPLSDFEITNSYVKTAKSISLNFSDDKNVTQIYTTSSNLEEVTPFAILKNAQLNIDFLPDFVGDVKVKVEVKDEENLSDKTDFYIKIYPNDFQVDILKAKSSLSFHKIQGKNSSQNSINSNLYLISSLENCRIDWKSSKEYVVDNQGFYKGQKGEFFTLKAIISNGFYTTSKTFLMKSAENRNLQKQVLKRTSKSLLGTNRDRFEIVSNLSLPTIDEVGKILIWESSNPDIITNSGYLYRENLLSDKFVTLTSTSVDGDTQKYIFRVLKIDKVQKSKNFQLEETNSSTIFQVDNFQYKVNETNCSFFENSSLFEKENFKLFLVADGKLEVSNSNYFLKIEEVNSSANFLEKGGVAILLSDGKIAVSENSLKVEKNQTKISSHSKDIGVAVENKKIKFFKFVQDEDNDGFYEIGGEIKDNGNIYLKSDDEVFKISGLSPNSEIEIGDNELKVVTEIENSLEVE